MNATGTKSRISLKNILYATDFSPSAEAALPYAVGLAKRYAGTVHGVHARYPATYPIVGPEAMPQVMDAAEEQAKSETQQLNEMLEGIPHQVTVSEGDIWPMIHEIAGREKTDLIVIGTHGRTGFKRLLLGSVAEEIFRRAACPVLTVGPHASGNTERRLEMKEILFATDFSQESLAALPYAVSLAQEHQAGLMLLHVVEPSEKGDLVHAELYADSIVRQLEKLVPKEAASWCEPKYKVEKGDTAEKILEIAIGLGADLIVLGVRGTDGGMSAATHISQSVAHRIVTQAKCPVLTVRG
ncbi:MAG TPA: universal stress protein [Candidatus Dormibacteraeota bacterium]|nr:universal stress protein [Candidatus Dormibacteraeota bacterium]